MKSLINNRLKIVILSFILFFAAYLVFNQFLALRTKASSQLETVVLDYPAPPKAVISGVKKADIVRVEGTASNQNSAEDPSNPGPTNKKSASRVRTELLGLKDNKWETRPTVAKTSAWIQNEKSEYQQLFGSQGFDLMVLPVQENLISVDRVSRLSFSRFIAEELRQKTGLRIMPAELTQRLLGERSYQFSNQDVASLSKEFDIKYLVSPYLHKSVQSQNKNSLTIVVSESKPHKVMDSLNFDLSNSSEYLEIFGFDESEKIVDEILPLLAGRNSPIEKIGSQTTLSIPETLVELTFDSDDPIKQAANLQLLAFLSPHLDEYERRRLFERSLVALKRSDGQHENYRLLKTRAIYYLFRRPAAVELLKDARNPAERAFLAYMNGNYTTQLKLTQTINNDYLKILSLIELKQLAFEFGISSEAVNIPISNNPAWQSLFINTIKNRDYWYVPTNIKFFRQLFGLFPKFDHIFNSAIKAKVIVGDTNFSDLIFEDVFASYLKQHNSSLCCGFDAGRVSEYDLLKFYRNLGIGNLAKSLHRTAIYQGREDNALSTINKYEVLIKDHPAILYYKMEALKRRVTSSSEIERPNIVRELVETSKRLVELSSGMNIYTVYADSIFKRYKSEYLASNPRLKVSTAKYKPDVPYQYSDYDWPSGQLHWLIRGSFIASDYTNSNFEILKQKYESENNPVKKAEVLKDINSRFESHPQKTLFLAGRLREQGDENAANELLKQAIENKAGSWPIYLGLGEHLIKSGQYQEGANVFLDYPEFRQLNPGDPVAISNHAYEAANLLFWRGAPKLAAPLFQISANLDTGSSASITSALRLAILNENYLRALKLAQYGANRYNSAYRYRDLLSLMSVLGASDDAMAGFNQLSGRITKPQIWSAAFITHKLKGYDFKQIIGWVNQQKETPRLTELARRYSILSGVADREIDESFVKGLEDISTPVSSNLGSMSYIFREDDLITYIDKGLNGVFKRPRFTINFNKGIAHCRADKKWYEWCNKNFQKPISVDESFLRAYYYLRKNESAKAYDTFLEHIRHFGENRYKEEIGSLILSYFALAAVGTDNVAPIDAYLTDKYENKNKKPFDYLLAKSVILASKKDISGSLDLLTEAFNNRPYTERRAIFSYYQILELTEFLFEMTDDVRYISLGLNWANGYRKVQPQYSWAHSFYAKYSREEKQRIEATAYAQYLDPNSAWLSEVPENIKQSATKWWQENNPFDPAKVSDTSLTQS